MSQIRTVRTEVRTKFYMPFLCWNGLLHCIYCSRVTMHCADSTNKVSFACQGCLLASGRCEVVCLAFLHSLCACQSAQSLIAQPDYASKVHIAGQKEAWASYLAMGIYLAHHSMMSSVYGASLRRRDVIPLPRLS